MDGGGTRGRILPQGEHRPSSPVREGGRTAQIESDDVGAEGQGIGIVESLAGITVHQRGDEVQAADAQDGGGPGNCEREDTSRD